IFRDRLFNFYELITAGGPVEDRVDDIQDLYGDVCDQVALAHQTHLDEDLAEPLAAPHMGLHHLETLLRECAVAHHCFAYTIFSAVAGGKDHRSQLEKDLLAGLFLCEAQAAGATLHVDISYYVRQT